MARTAPELDINAEQSLTLDLWRNTTERLAELKELEMTLRLKLVAELFDADKTEGSQTLAIGNGWKIESTKPINYAVENKNGEVAALLTMLPPDVADALFRWKPEVSVATYKNALPVFRNTLPGPQQMVLNEALVSAVTIKPGTPTLKLVPPKQ